MVLRLCLPETNYSPSIDLLLNHLIYHTYTVLDYVVFINLVIPLLTIRRYHLKDVIVGKIYFLLVRIKIKHMELSIIRRETTGSAPNLYNESETITKFEIMDGAPVRGETIPIRLFLGGFELTPTFRDVNKKFSTRYYLNLVLIDEENRRYFKQQEITVFRIP
jgi:vacuolar protein sorting-associated protein 26